MPADDLKVFFQNHGERLSKLEADSEWMKGALDEIRLHTKEVAGYAHQLVRVAHETATMSDAVNRAFVEIERERNERKEDSKEIRQEIAPVLKNWEGVLETSKWVKAGVIGVFAMIAVSMITIFLNLPK